MRWGLNRGQNARHAEDDDPIKAQASWEITHGTNHVDLTPEQDRRFRAVEAAHGDGSVAERLMTCQWLARHGGWRDDQ